MPVRILAGCTITAVLQLSGPGSVLLGPSAFKLRSWAAKETAPGTWVLQEGSPSGHSHSPVAGTHILFLRNWNQAEVKGCPICKFT